MQQKTTDAISYLVFHRLDQQPGLRHGVSLRWPPNADSTRPDAEIDFSPTHPERAQQNIDHFCRALQLPAENLARVRQVHGAEVQVLRALPTSPPEADALCTDTPGLPLMLLGADCPLIILYDPVVPALGLAHAGWRGTVNQVVMALVTKMCETFSCRPPNMIAGIGPAICAQCYQVGPDVARAALRNLRNADRCLTPVGDAHPGQPNQHWKFDLAQANLMQLVAAGLPQTNVEICRSCTFEQQQWFHSHRRAGARAGRWALIAGLV